MEQIWEVTESLEFVDGVESVLSLANIQNGEYFDVDLDDSLWNFQASDILNHPIYTNLLISKQGDVGADYKLNDD